MKEEEVVDDKVKEIFHWQRAHRRSRATEWIKRLLCTVVERESRLALSRAAYTHIHARDICIFTDREIQWCMCMRARARAHTYVSRDSLLQSSNIGIYEERDYYVRDVSDRKRDCERTGEGRKGKTRLILNDPEWNSPVKTGAEVKCGTLQLQQGGRPRSSRVNDRVELRSCWTS